MYPTTRPVARPVIVAAILACFAAATPALATTTFDFETTNPLSDPIVTGSKTSFAVTTQQARSGVQSIKFVDIAPGPFESWTYDLPFALTSGTISIWFHDQRGAAAFSPDPTSARWGGSIILEDKNNPADFGAVEITELPYGGGRYYGSEGQVDRGAATFIFDSISFPLRAVGFHLVEFQVGTTQSLVTVDGLPAARIGAPGGDKTLRLRIMNGSAGNGSAPTGTPGLPPGYQPNWYLTTVPFAPTTTTPWVTYDDLSMIAQTPAANAHAMGFEIISGTPEYDTVAIPFPVPVPANDNPNMRTFVNQWSVTTSASVVRTGAQAAYFLNAAPAFQSIAFDLSSVAAGQTVTAWFYDALGNDGSQTKFGGSVILESGLNPANFMAVEIWNFPYPASADPTPGAFNYFLTKGSSSGTPPDSFDSRVFGNRSIGWHRVDFTLNATNSTVTVDGIGNITKTGPGLNTSPRLRIMADSATAGGFANYTNIDELQHVYFATLDPYVYYDDVTLGGSAAATDWALFE